MSRRHNSRKKRNRARSARNTRRTRVVGVASAAETDLSDNGKAARRRARRKRQMRRRQRFFTTLFILFGILFAAIIFLNKKPEEQEESSIGTTAQGLPGAGAMTSLPASPSANNVNTVVPYQVNVGDNLGMYPGYADISERLTPGAALDVTKGVAAVDLDQVNGGIIEKAASAKAAMAASSYFTGCMQTVNTIMNAYGEGQWYAVMDASDNMEVFYEGMHPMRVLVNGERDGEEIYKTVNVPFKVVFTMYEDGSFYVKEFVQDGAVVDDYEAVLTAMING